MALILIVDDERPIRELLALFFEDNGHRTVTAANGQEALDRIEEELPDLVFADMMMPVLDGAELLRHIKANPATAAVPVLLASAIHTNAEGVSGALGFVPKPFDLDELEALVVRALAA